MKNAAGAIIGTAALVLTGCASMSGDECITGDWHAIGFEDGSRGYAADRLGDHRKACAKHGIAPDFVAWRDGHEEGLRLYCQPSRGFNLGANGGSYNGACAADLEPAFLDAWRTGNHLYTLRSKVDSANSAIHARERELEETQERMREAESGLLDSETATGDRVLLLADLKKLAEKTGEIESEIDTLIDERARHEERLTAYQAVLADSGY